VRRIAEAYAITRSESAGDIPKIAALSPFARERLAAPLRAAGAVCGYLLQK